MRSARPSPFTSPAPLTDKPEKSSAETPLAFDAINSRGLPLSEFDKIKNFCILVATKRDLSVRPEDEWYKALQQLEHFSVGSRENEDAFIADLYSSFHDESVSQTSVHRTLVDKYRMKHQGVPREEAVTSLAATYLALVAVPVPCGSDSEPNK